MCRNFCQPIKIFSENNSLDLPNIPVAFLFSNRTFLVFVIVNFLQKHGACQNFGLYLQCLFYIPHTYTERISYTRSFSKHWGPFWKVHDFEKSEPPFYIPADNTEQILYTRHFSIFWTSFLQCAWFWKFAHFTNRTVLKNRTPFLHPT